MTHGGSGQGSSPLMRVARAFVLATFVSLALAFVVGGAVHHASSPSAPSTTILEVGAPGPIAASPDPATAVWESPIASGGLESLLIAGCVFIII